MSFLLRASRSPRHLPPPLHRTLTTTSILHLKETTRDLPGQGDSYETHKQDQLRRQKAGVNFWKPELASESEANVAADRREHRGPVELQRATKDMAEVNMRAGTTQCNGID